MNRIVPIAVSVLSCLYLRSAEAAVYSTAIDFAYDEAFVASSGDIDKLVFSSNFEMPFLQSFDQVAIDLSHASAGEFGLRLTAPTGTIYDLLDGDGAETSVGDGSGLLTGLETYVFVNDAGAYPNVEDWDHTGSQPGGTYHTSSWPTGSWGAGTWNLSLFNDDVHPFPSTVAVGAVGTFTVSASSIPEPTAGSLLIAASLLFSRRRSRATRT